MEEIPQNLVMDIHWIHDKVTFPHWKDIRQNIHVHSLYWIQEGKESFAQTSRSIRSRRTCCSICGRDCPWR